MATTQSLLGLVNQLNSMEATFSTIMMEAVMKLASLTGQTISLDHVDISYQKQHWKNMIYFNFVYLVNRALAK